MNTERRDGPPPAVLQRLQLRDRIRNMSRDEQISRCARAFFRAHTERDPGPAELDAFVAGGDYQAALENPTTYERLASQAAKLGRTSLAHTWAHVVIHVEEGKFGMAEYASLVTLLTFEGLDN